MEIPINYLAVGLAVIANFVLGWLWYTPLFGKAWAKEMKFDTSETPKVGVMLRGMALMIIGVCVEQCARNGRYENRFRSGIIHFLFHLAGILCTHSYRRNYLGAKIMETDFHQPGISFCHPVYCRPDHHQDGVISRRLDVMNPARQVFL